MIIYNGKYFQIIAYGNDTDLSNLTYWNENLSFEQFNVYLVQGNHNCKFQAVGKNLIGKIVSFRLNKFYKSFGVYR